MPTSAIYPLYFLTSKPYPRLFYKDLDEYEAELEPRLSERLAIKRILPWAEAMGWSKTPGSGDPAVISLAMQGLLAWGDWAKNGHKVFSFSEPLTEAFSHSDVSQVSFKDVLPEKPFSAYLHFEGAPKQLLELAPGCLLEGAFVISKPPNGLRIVLCGRAPSTLSPLEHGSERYDLRIPPDCLDVGAMLGSEKALAVDLQDIEAARTKVAGDARAQEALDRLRSKMEKGAEMYMRALNLVVNGLAYLQAYSSEGEDFEEAWPTEAPQRLVAQAQSTSSRDKDRAKSKLWGLGYVPVTYVGREFAKTLGPLHAAGVKLHWRKGHWRNQAHGPAMTLRKLIWIRPTLVGKPDEDASTQ